MAVAAHGATGEQDTATLSADLPGFEHALLSIFESLVRDQAGTAARASVRLVCKQWRDVADGAWCTDLCLNEFSLGVRSELGRLVLHETLLTFLCRVGTHCTTLSLALVDPAASPLPLLECLPNLRTLAVQGCDLSSCAAALGRLTSLTCLSWQPALCSSDALLSLAALPGLSQLSLVLPQSHPDLVADGTLAAVLACLSSLTTLTLALGVATEGEALTEAIAALSRLQTLVLVLSQTSCLLPARWSHLAELQSLTLQATPGSTMAVGPGLAGLPCLRVLSIAGQVQAEAADLWCSPGLTSLELAYWSWERHMDQAAVDLPALQELQLVCVSHWSEDEAGQSAVPGLPEQLIAGMPQLTKLALRACDLRDPDSFARQLLEQASLAGSGLRDLDLCQTELQEEVPPCVIELRRLTRLNLSQNAISDLPCGPYLGQLQALDLSCCPALTLLPPALAHATALQELRLCQNPQMEVDAAAVTELASALELLDMRGCADPSHPQQQAALQQLAEWLGELRPQLRLLT